MSTGQAVGAAANVVGGELQGWANVLEKKRMFKEYLAEQQLQEGFRKQGGEMFQGFLRQSSPDAVRDYMATGKAAREKGYADIAPVPLSVVSPSPTTGVESQKDVAQASMRGSLRATLGSYSDWALQQTINNMLNQESLRQLVSTAGGEAQVFPYKMYQAQHSWDDLAAIGAAIQSIGGSAANYSQIYGQTPQFQQPQNWGTLPLNQQLDYYNQYMYYNSPQFQKQYPPGSFE